MTETSERILDAAAEVLGADPDAGLSDVAAAAGVVRRTVYGYFPSRSDLLIALTRRAASEIESAITALDNGPADAMWAALLRRVWPLVNRYRVLVALRRGPIGAEIHAQLTSVDRSLALLVARGQEEGAFGVHLPAAALGHVAWSMVFTLADHGLVDADPDARAVTTSSLLALGVTLDRVAEILDRVCCTDR